MFSNKPGSGSLSRMLGVYSLHKTNSVSSSLDSQEPHLEASVTLGSGSGQVALNSSNGVDPNKFFSSINMEPHLQASVTLGSGSGQVALNSSNGVDPNKFFSPKDDDDLTMPENKPRSNLGALRGLVSPLQNLRPVTKSK